MSDTSQPRTAAPLRGGPVAGAEPGVGAGLASAQPAVMDVEKLSKAPITLGVVLVLGIFLASLGWLFLTRIETNLTKLQDAQGAADRTLALQGKDIESIRTLLDKLLHPPTAQTPPKKK